MRNIGSILFLSVILLTSTITMVVPPQEASAQSIANSTSPYAMEGTAFTNMTGTYWKDSRYWTFHVGNSTYTEKPFPYLGDTQPQYPLQWDATTETFVHQPYVAPTPTVTPAIPNATPSTPPQQPAYQAPNYQPNEPQQLVAVEPARYPINIETETYATHETVLSDFTIVGTHEVFSYPHIVVNGVAQPYHVEDNQDQVIVRTNSVGGLIYDKDSCSYSIYENGWDGASKIDSVSIVGRSADINTDNWSALPENNLNCTVDVIQLPDSVTITSTKGVVTNSTGAGVQHELILNAETGIKETFRVQVQESGKKLGVTQTAHTGDILNIGGIDYNIAALDGMFMDREAIEANEAQIFEITQGLNYDIGAGWDRLWGISFEAGVPNKINLDYANAGEIEQTFLEIDPTWYQTITGTNNSLYDTGNNNQCDGDVIGNTYSGSPVYVRTYQTSHSYDCIRGYWEFDTTSLSVPIAQTTSVGFDYSVNGNSYGNYNCDIVGMANKPSDSSDSQSFTDITNGDVYVDNTDQCHSGNGSHTLGSTALSTLQSNNGWFAVAMKLDDENQTGSIRGQEINTGATLSIGYTLPPPYLPPAPSNLQTGAINSNQVNLEWTEPTGVTEEFGLNQELGYKVYKSDYAYAGKNLPGEQGQDSTSFDGYIGSTEMDANELLFHFDGLEGQTTTTPLDVNDIIAYYQMDASTSSLDGTVNGAVTTASNIGNWAGDLGQTITVQTGTTPLTPTYETDFSSSTGWTTGDLSIANNKLSGTLNNQGSWAYLDLSSENISDDQWVIRFGYKYTGHSGHPVPVIMGLADSTAIGTAVFAGGDFAGTLSYPSDPTNGNYNIRATDNGASSLYGRSTQTMNTNDQYYVEVIKDGTDLSMRWWDSSDYTDSGNSFPELTGTVPSTIQNFDYFLVKAYNTGTGSHSLEITDLKIYSGVTDASDIPVYTDYRAEQYQSGAIPKPITYEDDFTTPNLTWTQTGTGVSVSNNQIEYNSNNGSDKRLSTQFANALDDDEWVIHFDYHVTSWTTPAMYIGTLQSCDGNPSGGCTGDKIGIFQASDYASGELTLTDTDNGLWANSHSSYSSGGYVAISTGTQYYLELIRDGQDFTLNVYTGSQGGTLHGTQTFTTTGTYTGLQYQQFAFMDQASSTRYLTAEVDNLKIYDGVTDASDTPVYSYRNFADLGYSQDTERFVGQEFGSGSSTHNGFIDGSSNNASTDGTSQVVLSGGSTWAHYIIGGYGQPAGTSLEFQIDNTNKNVFYGFADTLSNTFTPAYGDPCDYCFYLTSGGDIWFFDSSTESDTGSNRASGDTYKIDYESGGDVKLYVKPSGGSYGSAIKTWTGASGLLYPVIQGYPGSTITTLTSFPLTTNADLVGTTIDNVQFRLEKVGSPTGTAEVGVWDSNNQKVHSFGNYDMSSATTTTSNTIATEPWTGITDTSKLVPDSDGTGGFTFEVARDGSQDSMYYDHGQNIDGDFKLRYKQYMAGGQNVASNAQSYLCMSDTSTQCDPDASYSSGTHLTHAINYRNNNGSGGCVDCGDTWIATGTTYGYNDNLVKFNTDWGGGTGAEETAYWEFAYDSTAGTITANWYTDENYTTLKETQTATQSNISDDIRYFIFHNVPAGSTSGTSTNVFSDVKLCTTSSCSWNDISYLDKTFTSSTPYTIQAGDKLGILMDATGSDDDNFVQMYYGKAETNITPVTYGILNSGTDEGDGVYKTTSQSWSNIGGTDQIFKIGGNTKVSLKTTSNHLEFGFSQQTSGNCFECSGSNVYGTDNAIVHPTSSGGYGSGNGGNVYWGGASAPSSSNLVATSWDASSYTTGTDFTMEIKPNGDIEFAMDGVVKHTWVGVATGNEYYFYVGNYATGESRVVIPTNTDYDSSLSKMKYGTFPNLDEGIPAVQEQTSSFTYTQDFSTYTTQAEAHADFNTNESGRIWVDVSNDYIDWDVRNDNSDDTMYYDLGQNIGSGDWNFKSKINWSDLASGTTVQNYIGVSNTSGSSADSQDFIGVGLLTGDNQIRAIHSDDTGVSISGNDDSISWATSTPYYLEIDKTDTTMTVNLRTGSHTGTIVATVTDSVGTITDMQYLKFQNRITSNSPSPRMQVDDINFSSTVITQPYVPPVTYDLRFQSTLGNAQSGAGLEFDGVDDYIQLDSKYDFIHQDSGSISFWVNPDTVDTNEMIVNSMATSGANGPGIDISSKGPSNGLRINLIDSNNQWMTNLNTPDPLTIGQWQHVVVTTKTVDGTQTAKVYVDGVLKDEEDYAPNASSAGGDMRIGKHATDPNSYAWFDGKLDEFTIWDYELDYFAVETLYNQGDGRDPSTLQAFIQNNIKPVTYYNLDDGGATNQYPPDAVVYNVCEDITGNDCQTPIPLDGTNNGATTGVTGKLGNAWDFDGSNDYVSTSWIPSDFQIDDPFSISLWFKTSSTNFSSLINSWGTQNGGGNNGWNLIDSGTSASFRISSNWGASPQEAIRVNTGTNSAFSDGNWHHLVVTYDGTDHTGVTYYLDGSEESSSADLTGTVGAITYTLPVEIGAYSSVHTDNYDGTLDQVLIYDTELSSSQVSSIYNSGSGTASPSTTNLIAHYDFEQTATLENQAPPLYVDHSDLHDGTITGTSQTTGIVGNSINFDGSNDYITTDYGFDFLHDGTPNTIAFWAKADSTSQNDPAGLIATTNAGGSSQKGLAIFIANGDMIGYYMTSGSGVPQNSQDIYQIPDTDWHHYIFTYDGSLTADNLVMYVDGSQHTTGTHSGAQFGVGLSHKELELGRTSQYFDGQMDEVYIFKDKVVTPAEALSIYQAGLARTQLSNAIVSVSGEGTYLIDKSGIHQAVIPSVAGDGGGGDSCTDPCYDIMASSWTDNDPSYVSYDSANNEIDFLKNTSSVSHESYAPIGTTVDGDFVLRYTIEHTTENLVMNGGNAGTLLIGISSGTSFGGEGYTSGTGQDSLYGILAYHGSWDNGNMLTTYGWDGSSQNNNWGPNGIQMEQSDNASVKYVQHVRDGGVYQICVFDDAEYTTPKSGGSGNGADNGCTTAWSSNASQNAQGMTHLGIVAYNQGYNSGSAEGTIKDIKLWNGVTSVPEPSSSGGATFETGKVGTKALLNPIVSVTAEPLTSNEAVSISSNAFSPTSLSIPTGSTVTWTNSDNTIHQVQSSTSESNTHGQQTYGDWGNIYQSGQEMAGMKLETANAKGVGELLNSFTITLKVNGGSPTGTVTGYVIDSTGTVATSSNTIDASTISGASDYTFNFDGTYQLKEDDRIVAHYISQGSSHYLGWGHTTSEAWDGAETVRTYKHSGNWNDDSSKDTAITIATSKYDIRSSNISAGGGTFSHTFNTAGTYDYVCPIHSSMTGQIVVADSYSLPSGTEDFTVSSWIKTTQIPGTPASIVFDNVYSSGWVDNNLGGSYGDAYTTTDSIYLDVDNTSTSNYPHNSMNYELPSALSNEQWVMRFYIDVQTMSSTLGNAYFNVMMIDDMWLGGGWDGQNENSANGDFISAMFHVADGYWGRAEADNFTHSSGSHDGGTISYSAGQTHYFELKRNSATEYQVDYHGTSGFGTVSGSTTRTIAETIEDLDTIAVGMPYQNGMGSWDIEVKDIQVCDGQTDWANCSATPGAPVDEIGTVLSFETQEPSTTATQNIVDDDFSTDNFTHSGSNTSVSSGTFNFSPAGQSSTNGAYHQVSATIPNDDWTLRAKLDITGRSAPSGDNHQFFIALSDNSGVSGTYTTAGDYVGFGDRVGTGTNGYRIFASNDGGNWWDNIQQFSRSATTETLYVEMKRVGGTTFSVELFDDSAYSNSLEVQTMTIDSALEFNHLTIFLYQGNGTGGDYSGTVDDITLSALATTTYPTKVTAFEVEPTAMRIVDIVPAENNVSFTDNFDSDNWTHQDSSVTSVTGGVLDYRMQAADSSVDNAWVDLGSALPEQWVLRWEATYDAYPQSGNGHNHGFCLRDADGTVGTSTNMDAICWQWGEPFNTSTGQDNMGILALDNQAAYSFGSVPQQATRSNTHGITYDGTTHYFELTRDSAGSATIDIKSGSHSGTSVSGFPATDTTNVASTIDGLQYLVLANRSNDGNRNGQADGTIDNVQLCSGQNDWANCEVAEVRTNILEETVSLTPNTWKHVSWVRDGTSWKSIVDGTQVGSTVTQSTSLGTPLPPSKTETVDNHTLTSSTGTTDWNFDNSFTCITDNSPKIDFTQGSCNDNRSASYDIGELGDTWEVTGYTEWSGSYSGSRPIFWIGVSDQEHICAGSGGCGVGSYNDVTGIFLMHYSENSNSGSGYKGSFKTQDKMDAGGDQTNLSPNTGAYTTPYWFKIERNGSEGTVSIYPDNTFGTPTASYTSTDIGEGYQYLNIVTYKQGSGRSGSLSEVTLPSTTTTVNNYYHIGTQPDSATNPLAVIDELHIHSAPAETVVAKSHDRGDADFQLVDTIAFSTEGGTVQYADTSVTPGDAPIYQIYSYNLAGETELQTMVQGSTVSLANAPTNLQVTNGITQAQLTWTVSSDLGGGNNMGSAIYRSTDNLNWTLEAQQSSTTPAYTDTTANVLGQTYYYKVATVNEAGIGAQSAMASVTIADSPDAPTNVQVVPAANKVLTVSWTAPNNNGAPIASYAIDRSTDGVTGWTNQGTVATTSFTDTDQSKTNGQVYFYRVSATNSVGTSPYSANGSGTAGDVPDAVPTLTATAVPNYTIDLVWTAPNDNGYAITSYDLYQDDGVNNIKVYTGTNTSFSSTGLTAGTNYNYMVVATNALGTSPQSLQTPSAIAGDIPSDPTNLTVTVVPGGQLDLSWTTANGNGYPFTGEIQVSTDGGSTWTQEVAAHPSASTQYQDTGLTNGVTYDYRVNASNALGTSGWSNVAGAKAGDVPDAPPGLSATTISSSEIDVQWLVPSDNGYAITQYNLERSVDQITWTVIANQAGVTFSDTGLTQSTTYYYRVSAQNALGTSQYSTTASGQTFGVPGIPTGLTITPISTSQLDLSWTAPAMNGYPFVSYTIEQSTDGGTTWNTLTTVTQTTYSHTGLTANTDHLYRVFATNTFGSGSPSVQALAPTLPEPPAAVTVTVVSDTELDVTWNTPTGSPPATVGFKLERSDDQGATWTVVVANTGNTNQLYQDTGLTPLTEYFYRVSTINASGTSVVSPSGSNTTYGPPDAPTSLTATPLPGAQIQLDWIAPVNNNGDAVNSYQIERSLDNVSWSVLTNTGTTAVTYTDTGLNTPQTYYYRVSATSGYGTGAASNMASAIASDVPDQVTGLTGTALPSAEIKLDWTTPANNGYAITGYVIERSIDAGQTWGVLVADTQSTAVTYTDTALTIGNTYNYRVAAINAVGTGVVSSDIAVMAGDIPDAPVISLTAQAGNQIEVTWAAPNANAYPLTGYAMERSTDGINWSPLTTPIASATNFVDTGLTAGTTYHYRMVAINQIGASAWSNAPSVVAGDVPSQPQAVVAQAVSDTAVQIQWQASNGNGYIVTGYKVERSTDGGATWTVVTSNTQSTTTTYNDSGLTPQTDYWYRVSGINSIGAGPVSLNAASHTFGPPEPITVNQVSSDTASITHTWSAPYDHGSPITGYRLEVKSWSTGQWINLGQTQSLTDTHSNLYSNTEYEYQIIAINAYGNTPTASSIFMHTQPTAPVGGTATVISGTQIDVSWNAVADQNNHGNTLYELQWSDDNGATWNVAVTGISVTNHSVTGLNAGSSYVFRIQASNPQATGPWTSQFGSSTTFTTPSAATNLTIQATAPLEVKLTWSAPSDNGNDPNGLNYHIERSTDNVTWTSIATGITALQYTDSNLPGTTTLYWRIVSHNSAGAGPATPSVSYTTPSPPTPPANLVAEPIGSTNSAVKLDWDVPSSTFGYNIIGYMIERNSNNSGWTTLVGSTGNTLTVYTNTGLSGGNTYEYRVSAITQVGTGGPSNVVSVELIDSQVVINGNALFGNTVEIIPEVTTTVGSPLPNIVQVKTYQNNAVVDTTNYANLPLQIGTVTLNTINAYPIATSDFYVVVTMDSGYAIQSNQISLTPSAPFTGDILDEEYRNTTFEQSTLDLTVQPSGANVIVKYQPQDPSEDPIIYGYENVQQAIQAVTDVDPNTDYYGSVYVNPTFEYSVNATTNQVTTTCTADDITFGLCDPNDIPKGVPAVATFKSFKDPASQSQLGLEPMGDLFGLPMVFLFIIGLAAMFTGKTSPIGVIFIAVTIGIMWHLGYVDFFEPSATWVLIVIIAILGLFLGKRWS